MATRSYRSLALVAAVGVFMLSCTKNQKVEQKSLRIHLPIVKMNLDPQKMEDAYSMAVVSQIHRGLLRYNNAGDVRADLAESWTESPDHLSYKFKLKKATFSDGTAITATHVQMTFARLFFVGSSMAADIDSIAGAASFKANQNLADFGVKVLSSDTVEFRLSKPSAIFLMQLAVADCSILRLADFKAEPSISVAGSFSGPYKIVNDLKDNSLTIEKWRADALDSASPPVKITYFMTDRSPMELALAGETDSLDHDRIEAEDKKKLESAGWATAPTELAGEIFVVLNPATIPDKVRRVLYSSVDSKALFDALERPSYKAAYGLIPFVLPGELGPKDVAGLKLEVKPISGKRPSIQLDFEKTSDLEEKTAVLLQKLWTPLNIDVVLNPLPKGEKLQRLFGKKSQAIIARKGTDYPDGFSVLGYFKGNYESNYFYVDDKKIDQALLEVLQVFEPEKRVEGYKEIQKQILQHYTLIPLFFGSEASGFWSSKVKTVPSHPLGSHTLPMESVEMGGSR